MKIISWNTYLAPTMPNRFIRKKYVIEKIKEWMKLDIDIISLQELNDFTLGLFGYLYFLLKLYKYCNIFFQRFFDLLFIIEGILFPLFYHNNSKEIEEFVEANNYYLIKSDKKNSGLNGGLVVISKHKSIDYISLYLPTDLIHIPNILFIKYDNFIFINNHFIPNLPNYTFLYKIVNMLNYIFCINVKKKQIEGINMLNTFTLLKYNDIYVVGDLNIRKKMDLDLYNYFIDKTNLIDSIDYICTEHHLNYYDGEKNHEEDQIDYILSNKDPLLSGIRLEDTIHISDHYPILAEY